MHLALVLLATFLVQHASFFFSEQKCVDFDTTFEGVLVVVSLFVCFFQHSKHLEGARRLRTLYSFCLTGREGDARRAVELVVHTLGRFPCVVSLVFCWLVCSLVLLDVDICCMIHARWW